MKLIQAIQTADRVVLWYNPNDKTGYVAQDAHTKNRGELVSVNLADGGWDELPNEDITIDAEGKGVTKHFDGTNVYWQFHMSAGWRPLTEEDVQRVCP